MEKELFNYFLQLGKLEGFSPIQIKKFEYACKKSIIENPDLKFEELLIACKVYLNFIRDFPELQF